MFVVFPGIAFAARYDQIAGHAKMNDHDLPSRVFVAPDAASPTRLLRAWDASCFGGRAGVFESKEDGFPESFDDGYFLPYQGCDREAAGAVQARCSQVRFRYDATAQDTPQPACDSFDFG
jgi:hypothetical protein